LGASTDPVNNRCWTYRRTLHGNVEHESRVTLRDDGLLWELAPADEFEEDGEKTSCLEDVDDFREFGPPETPAWSEAPPEVLDALCEAVGATDPPWRRAIPEALAAFFAAARADDVDGMQALVQRGVDLNACDHQKRNALWYAAEAASERATRWLLEQGCDVNAQDRYGRTPLMDAAFRGDEVRAELYRRHDADLALRDKSGRTAWLHGVASCAGGALMFSIRSCTKEDWPRALHLAAWSNNIAWMEGEDWYVEAVKPDVNTREGRYDRTPLQACFQSWRPSPHAVRWLVENGADLSRVDAGDGTTPLHHAAKLDLPWLVPACVRAGVKPASCDHTGRTAWDYALLKHQRRRLLKAFVDAGAAPTGAEAVSEADSREPASDPLTLHREWNWQARSWSGRQDQLSVVLRRGTLTWRANNWRVEQSVARFRIEGPPRSGDAHRTLPGEMLDELCQLIGESVRIWEVPCSKPEREARVKAWAELQPPPPPLTNAPPPPPHQSGRWCYARLDIEDHFTTQTGAGGDGTWSCWMEFPAEWCYCQRAYLEQWLADALQRAYVEMNRKASAAPDGGTYALKRCVPEVLARAEAVKQPWAERGKVLYQTDERERPPTVVGDDEKRRPLAAMGDPANPPQPVPISPPPLSPKLRQGFAK